MRFLVTIALLNLLSLFVSAQKPLLDTGILDNWPAIRSPSISANGQYITYDILNTPTQHKTTIVTSLPESWEEGFLDITLNKYTEDNKALILLNTRDTLKYVILGRGLLFNIPNVEQFDVKIWRSTTLLAYQTKNSELHIRNMSTLQERVFSAVLHFIFTEDGYHLILQTGKQDDTLSDLNIIDLSTDKAINIVKNSNVTSFKYHDKNKLLAFTTSVKSNQTDINKLWTFSLVDNHLSQRITDLSLNPEFSISHIDQFNTTGDLLFFSLIRKSQLLTDSKPSVHIWSYLDPQLQSETKDNLGNAHPFFSAVLCISNGLVTQLEKDKREFIQTPINQDQGWLFLETIMPGSKMESSWNRKCGIKFSLISPYTGAEKNIEKPIDSTLYGDISPNGKYITWSNSQKTALYSYSISSASIHNLFEEDNFRNSFNNRIKGVPLWANEDKCFVLYDQSDIWLLDPNGHDIPTNITNGYGKRNHLIFKLLEKSLDGKLNLKFPLVIKAFDKKTKESGFYKIIKIGQDPLKLSMSECAFKDYGYFDEVDPIKAKKANVFLVQKMTASRSSNCNYTSDFITFTPISHVSPEQNYNWYTTQLINWKAFDGTNLQGVLYKPEDFDSTQKYPVIFNIYEDLSDNLYSYIEPGNLGSEINIPYFVSNHYLVFTPDIAYKTGDPGGSAYNCVISGAQLIKQFPFVDTNKIGIQGHSFGGYEVNYLITHTHLFAAAMSGSGPSDLIRGYGSTFTWWNGQMMYEVGQFRMGATLWERPSLYIENSPIFGADKVTTPLLMMNNKNDEGVRFEQGLEFYLALRRLGKPVWMLQYEDANHVLMGHENRMDYCVRMKQFFDHYLKNTPAPLWMTRTTETFGHQVLPFDYKLDDSIPTPGHGLTR